MCLLVFPTCISLPSDTTCQLILKINPILQKCPTLAFFTRSWYSYLGQVVILLLKKCDLCILENHHSITNWQVEIYESPSCTTAAVPKSGNMLLLNRCRVQKLIIHVLHWSSILRLRASCITTVFEMLKLTDSITKTGGELYNLICIF